MFSGLNVILCYGFGVTVNFILSDSVRCNFGVFYRDIKSSDSLSAKRSECGS